MKGTRSRSQPGASLAPERDQTYAEFSTIETYALAVNAAFRERDLTRDRTWEQLQQLLERVAALEADNASLRAASETHADALTRVASLEAEVAALRSAGYEQIERAADLADLQIETARRIAPCCLWIRLSPLSSRPWMACA